MVAHPRSSVGTGREPAVMLKTIRAIRFVVHVHVRKWALMELWGRRDCIAHAVTALEQPRPVHMMNATGSIFLEREFGKCCAMVYCHRRKLSVLNRRALPYREFNQKGSMRIMNLSDRLETRSKVFFHFMCKQHDSGVLNARSH